MVESNNKKQSDENLPTSRKIVLASFLVLAYMSFGALIGLIPKIYPEEARRRGAIAAEVRIHKKAQEYLVFQLFFYTKILSQYGSVHGIAYWAICVSSPILGALGSKISVKAMFSCAGVIQAISAFLMGSLTYVEDKNAFLAGSYISR